MLDLPPTVAGHVEALTRAPVLERVETGGAVTTDAPNPELPLRVVFWNAERLKYVADSAGFLAGLDADVILLAEVDIGMARSGQKHTIRELAAALGMAFVYATEFVELGLGDRRERAWFEGHENRGGLHGGAILARVPLSDPAVIRLGDTGDWFDGSRGERRVGGRIAVVARADAAGTDIAVAALHLESHGSPASRADEISRLLGVLDAYAAGAPIIVGGDLNTNTADRDVPDWPEHRREIAEADPQRLQSPVAFEPLFEHLAEAGFDCQSCNVAGVTQRTRPDGTPVAPFAKLDWLFCRDLEVAGPAIHPALSCDGSKAISDHDAISAIFSRQTGNHRAGRHT